MDLEGEDNRYTKLHNVNTRLLVKTLQSHGIRVLGSSIIGLEHHTPANIDRIIDYAVSHDTVFHQFMLYTPVAGTPLYEVHHRNGTLFPESEFSLADAHGQYRFNYRHPHIHNGQEEQFLLSAFQRDFSVNGPSLARLIDTTLTGWQRYQKHPEKRIRKRFGAKVNLLRTAYSAAVWAMTKYYRDNGIMQNKLSELLNRLYAEFGWTTRLFSASAGSFIYFMLKREEKRLARGWSYEPGSFYEKNAAAVALESKFLKHSQTATECVRWVTAKLSPFPG